MRKWEQQAQPLRGLPVVARHKNMTYLWSWLGVREVATLEPKPGVEPNGGQLSQLKAQLAAQPAKMVVRGAYEDPRASRWLSEQAGIPDVVLPFTVGGNDKATDLFGLFDSTLSLLPGGGEVSWSAIDLSILLPAFAAGVLVLATHVPLGAQVLRKGIVFIDLAIAQIAGLGVILAGMLELAPGGWQVQLAAATAACLGALLLTWTEKKWPEVQEAQIGVLFVLAATAASSCSRRTRTAGSICATSSPGRSSG